MWLEDQIGDLCRTAARVGDIVATHRLRRWKSGRVAYAAKKASRTVRRRGKSVLKSVLCGYHSTCYDPRERWSRYREMPNLITWHDSVHVPEEPSYDAPSWRTPTRLCARLKKRFKIGLPGCLDVWCMLINPCDPTSRLGVYRVVRTMHEDGFAIEPHGALHKCGSCGAAPKEEEEEDVEAEALRVIKNPDATAANVCSVRRYARCARLRRCLDIKWVYATKYDEDGAPPHTPGEWDGLADADGPVHVAVGKQRSPRVLPCYGDVTFVADVLLPTRARFHPEE